MKKISVTKIKSHIGRKPSDKRTLEALGLKKVNSTVIKELSPQVLGMIRSVSHLVFYKDLEK